MSGPDEVRLCACGCGTPLQGRTQIKYAGRAHCLRVHGGDGRNNSAARASNARTLALKRLRRWTAPYIDALVKSLGDADALSRRQLAALSAALSGVSAAQYHHGYKAGWNAYHARVKDGRLHLPTPALARKRQQAARGRAA